MSGPTHDADPILGGAAPARGTPEFEKALAAKFQRYIPSPAPDSVLLMIASAYFHNRSLPDNAIDSAEQSFEAIRRMLPTQFRSTIRGSTTNGDSVELVCWYDNLEYVPPHYVSGSDRIQLPATPMLAILTNQTYSCGVTADFHAILTLTETSEEKQSRLRERIKTFLHISPALSPSTAVEAPPSRMSGGAKRTIDVKVQVVSNPDSPNRIEVHQKKALVTQFPLMVGTKWCKSTELGLTPIEASILGEDPGDIGGYMINGGRPITCGSVYTHTPNFPMSMNSQYKDIEVYVTIMTRRDPFFGNTYQLVPTITREKVKIQGSRYKMGYDLVIEIMWNQPDMNPKEVGSVKAHLSRVPIYALFNYYGCDNMGDMINYIFPGVQASDGRVRFLVEAVTTGKYHAALFKTAHPVTPTSSLLHIGECILSQEAKKRFRSEITASIDAVASEMHLDSVAREQVLNYFYEERIRSRAKDILSGTFFFNVNTDSKKTCLSMGSIIAHMIGIKLGIDTPTDRSNISFNRIQPIGEQFTGEAKKHIKKELIDPIVTRISNSLFGKFSWEAMKDAFPFEVTAPITEAGNRLALKLRRAFKSSSKAKGQQPRLLEEPYDPKNVLFVWSKINEVTIRPSVGEKATGISYVRRQVHPSHALFLCGSQTPESGADVGRYHQPSIYGTVSTCEMETPVRILLRMRDTSHPSPNPRLESGAESAEEAAEEVVAEE